MNDALDIEIKQGHEWTDLVDPANDWITGHAAELHAEVIQYTGYLLSGKNPAAYDTCGWCGTVVYRRDNPSNWVRDRDREHLVPPPDAHEVSYRYEASGSERTMLREGIWGRWQAARRAERARHSKDTLAEQLFATIDTGAWYSTADLAKRHNTNAASITDDVENIAKRNPHLVLERVTKPRVAVRLARKPE